MKKCVFCMCVCVCLVFLWNYGRLFFGTMNNGDGESCPGFYAYNNKLINVNEEEQFCQSDLLNKFSLQKM